MFLALPEQASTGIIYIGNQGQTEHGTHATYSDTTTRFAQSFRTDSGTDGHMLSSVQFEVVYASGEPPVINSTSAGIYTDVGGNPGTLVQSLVLNRSQVTDTRKTSAVAVPKLRLAPNTWYVVVIALEFDGGTVYPGLRTTTSNAEDAGGRSGWQIGDAMRVYNNSTSTWGGPTGSLAGASLEIAVRVGRTQPLPSDPTGGVPDLTAAAAAGSSGAITLNWSPTTWDNITLSGGIYTRTTHTPSRYRISWTDGTRSGHEDRVKIVPNTETGTHLLFLKPDTEYRVGVSAQYPGFGETRSVVTVRTNPQIGTPNADRPLVGLAFPDGSKIKRIREGDGGASYRINVSEFLDQSAWYPKFNGISVNLRKSDREQPHSVLVAPASYNPVLFIPTSPSAGYRGQWRSTPRLLAGTEGRSGPFYLDLLPGDSDDNPYRVDPNANRLCIEVIPNGASTPRNECPTVRIGRGRQAPPRDTPLTAELVGMPESHGGNTFTLEVRFSEPLSISYKTLRDSVFTVTNGAVTSASRINGSNRNWEIEVEPSADDDTTIALPPTTDCAATGAICLDGRRLSTAFEEIVLHTLLEPELDPGAELTVAFETEPPAEHDGSGEIEFRIAFSENLDPYSYTTLRDASLSIYQGATRLTPRVERVDKKDPERMNQRWDVKVTPISKEFLSIGLGPTHECTDNGAMCTEDDRALSHNLRWVVLGPLALSVADASVREADGATVDFTVTMSRASASTVTVDFATSEGSATPGSDYTETSGTLTFAPDDTTKTVSVPVLNDGHNDGGETFTLTLSDASGGNAYIADATATGTIENTDPMPQAWLARFGRTIASQAVDAVGGRLEGGGGSHVTLGGQALSLSGGAMELGEHEDAARVLEALAGEESTTVASRSMTGRELLLGSAFQLSAGGGGDAPEWTAWGRFATGGFDAEEDGVRLDASVTSGFLGADYARGRWLAGVALSLSEGEGEFALIEDGDGGDVESTLTTVYPYARLGLKDRVDVWGLASYGTGGLTLTLRADETRMRDETYETDVAMRMGAVGVRGAVLSPEAAGGLAVAVRSDAFWVRTSSDAVRESGGEGKLAASEADVTRLRLIVESSRSFATGAGTLTPSLALGVRHDGGDAETGTGIEAGAGLRYAGDGVTVEGAVRTLIAHESSGYEEWGASGAVRIDPGASGRGLSLTLAPTWGRRGAAPSACGACAMRARSCPSATSRPGEGSRRRSATASGSGGRAGW